MIIVLSIYQPASEDMCHVYKCMPFFYSFNFLIKWETYRK